MEPIQFKEANSIYGKKQYEYIPLPAHKTEDGIVTSCWRLSLCERIKLLFSGCIWLSIMTFNQKLQPQKLSLDKPEEIDTDILEVDSV